MKLDQIKTSITQMSDDELREFILENRRAQKRYAEEYNKAKTETKPASFSEAKKREDKLKAILEGLDPEVLKKLLDEKGVTNEAA